MKKTKNIKRDNPLLLYSSFFAMIFVLVAIVWYFFVDGVFFYCSDKVPIIDLFPPFVHGALYGDYFNGYPFFTYAIWTLALLIIFITPWILTKYTIKKKAKFLKNISFIFLLFFIIFTAIFGYLYTWELIHSPTFPPQHEVQRYNQFIVPDGIK